MEQDESYNLYHRAIEFRELVKQEGYNIVANSQITKKVKPTESRPNDIIYPGEIVSNRYLIIHTSQIKDGDERFNQAVSDLQKLAKSFSI